MQSRFTLPILIVSALLASCKKSAKEPVPVPQNNSGCPIKTETIIRPQFYNSLTVPDTDIRVYHNDKNGNLIRTVETDKQFYPAGNVTGFQTIGDYTYDVGNFVIGSINDMLAIDAGPAYYDTNIGTYTYKNGKIVRKVSQKTSSPVTETWTWNPDGTLNSYDITGYSYNDEYEYHYAGGKLSKITKNWHSGPIYDIPVETDASGRITRLTDKDFDYLYQYDKDGDVIRRELWIAGKYNDGSTYTYDDHIKSPAHSGPVYKGFPQGLPTVHFPDFDRVTVHNLKTQITYQGGAAGQPVIVDQFDFVNSYDAGGNVSKVVINDYDKDKKLKESYPILYTYTNCH